MPKTSTPKLNIEKGKPLVLPDGTKITKNASNQTFIESKEEQEHAAQLDEILTDPFEDNIETFQRTLADINVPVEQFNPTMLILAYSMWGLDEHAIARFLDRPVEQITSIMQSDLFSRTRKELLEAVRYAEASSIHGYITQHAKDAAKTVVSKMTAKKDDISLSAARDILDRAGFRPVDKVEHSIRFEDELRIVHLNEQKPTTIDVGI